MKKIALGVAALTLSFMSWSAVAGEGPTEEQCKAMGEQHGISGEKLDAWMKKCLDHSMMKHDKSEKGEMHGKEAMDKEGKPGKHHDMKEDGAGSGGNM
ncbi:MAG: hypothetical protein AABZ84_05355 [Pseudomonadota bacterium]